MLFMLRKVNGDVTHYLKNGKEYSVGRKGTDIVIDNDQSISRKHALIKIRDNRIILMDLNSKYNTFYQKDKMEPNVELTIKEGEQVRFGVYQSIYKIEKARIITTGSGLNTAQKAELKQNVQSLGGTLINNWSAQCTHLTVQEITLTLKVLHALIDDKPIVNLAYWSKAVESAENQCPAPLVSDYKPPLAEPMLNIANLSADPKRKTLFKDKVFVFSSQKILMKMAEIIEKTGGEAVSWSKELLSLPKIKDSIDKYLFIQSDDIKDTEKSLNVVYQHLNKLGLRTIPIQEIAMAILLCSCEKDCNPMFDRAKQVFIKQDDNFTSQDYSLAHETPSQSVTDYIQPKQEICIPDSYQADVDDLFPQREVCNKKQTPCDVLDEAIDQNSDHNFTSKIEIVNSLELSSIKRPSDEDVFVQPKRMKMENKDHQKEKSSETTSLHEEPILLHKGPTQLHKELTRKREEPMPLPKEPTQLPKEPTQLHKELSSTHEEPFRKRKAESNLERPPSKKTVVENPFALFKKWGVVTKKPVTEDNPFVSLRVAKSPVDQNNSHVEEIPDSFNENNIDDEPPPTDTEIMSPLQLSNTNSSACHPQNNILVASKKFNSSGWLSRGCKNVKQEEVDESLKGIYEKFKDTMKIERKCLLRKDIPPRIIYCNADLNGSVVKNFKKFKKVQPLHPQVNIIRTVAPNADISRPNLSRLSATIVDDEPVNSGLSPLMPPPPARKAGQRKRFNF